MSSPSMSPTHLLPSIACPLTKEPHTTSLAGPAISATEVLRWRRCLHRRQQRLLGRYSRLPQRGDRRQRRPQPRCHRLPQSPLPRFWWKRRPCGGFPLGRCRSQLRCRRRHPLYPLLWRRGAEWLPVGFLARPSGYLGACPGPGGDAVFRMCSRLIASSLVARRTFPAERCES